MCSIGVCIPSDTSPARVRCARFRCACLTRRLLSNKSNQVSRLFNYYVEGLYYGMSHAPNMNGNYYVRGAAGHRLRNRPTDV